MIELTCEGCGAAFLVKNYRRHTAKYCSFACSKPFIGAKSSAAQIGKPKPHMIGNKYGVGHKPTNAFEPGHTPWHAGTKGIRFSPRTEFKRGERSINAVPVGTESIRVDKKGKPRVFVKIAEPNKWKLRTQIVWEAEHGPIPPGYLVHHKNRISTDDTLENMGLMTRAEHINEHRKELLSARLISQTRQQLTLDTRDRSTAEQANLFGATVAP